MQEDSIDPTVRLIAECVAAADLRQELVSLVGEVVNTWHNLDAVCATGEARCKEIVSISRLEQLLAVLNEKPSVSA